MARYSLNLPKQLKKDAEEWADRQGVSLNQFILWAVSEKVGSLAHTLDDPDYPGITYRRGASGVPSAVLRSSGLRVQTIAIANKEWGMPPETIAEDYDLLVKQVKEALAFYNVHQAEFDALESVENDLTHQANE